MLSFKEFELIDIKYDEYRRPTISIITESPECIKSNFSQIKTYWTSFMESHCHLEEEGEGNDPKKRGR